MDTESASRLLGVSARRVAQLAAGGDISKAARGIYDRLSIERHLALQRGSGVRAWDAATAWAAIALLSGWRRKVDWVPERSRYRLEAALRDMTAADLVAKARHRASVAAFTGHSSVTRAVREEVIVRDWQRIGMAGVADEGVDGYVDVADLDAIIGRYALARSSSGNITLRATSFDLGTVRALSRASDVLIALDAAGSVDVRTRSVGDLVLERALDRFRENSGRRR